MTKEFKRNYKLLKKIEKELKKEYNKAARSKGDERLMYWARTDLLEQQKKELLEKLAA